MCQKGFLVAEISFSIVPTEFSIRKIPLDIVRTEFSFVPTKFSIGRTEFSIRKIPLAIVPTKFSVAGPAATDGISGGNVGGRRLPAVGR